MKKITTLCAISLCWSMEAQYCLPAFQYGADSNMITHVTFGSINNPSPFQSGTTSIYEDFTSMSTDLQAGNSYPISVKGPSGTFPGDVVVFIDFNRNGSFNDAGESFYIGRLQEATPFNALTINGTITVPADASAGTTRMRVLKNSNVAAYSNPTAPNSINTACDTNLRSGQAEDYTVNIEQANLSTKDIAKNSLIKISPNPTTGSITIKTIKGLEKYEIFSVSGQKIMEGTAETIHLDGLTSGNYLLKIQMKDKTIITEKIIKK